MIQFLLLMAIAAGSATSEKPHTTCQLSSAAFSDRKAQIQKLFAGSTETRELEDGYAFRFPGDGDWAEGLLQLIRSERQCCQFFTFELSFEPNQGPVWFRVRGSREIKDFLETLFQ